VACRALGVPDRFALLHRLGVLPPRQAHRWEPPWRSPPVSPRCHTPVVRLFGMGGVAGGVGPVVTAASGARVGELEARGARLVGVLNAASAGLVEVIALAVSEGVWAADGIRSPQHWAALRFGLSSRRAARLVAAAEALVGLPRVREAFVAGEVGEDHVAEIARSGVDPRCDAAVADLARAGSVSQLRRGLSALPHRPAEPADGPEPEKAPEPERRRRVGFGPGELGGWELHATGLDEAEGAVIERALGAARDDLFRGTPDDDRHDDAVGAPGADAGRSEAGPAGTSGAGVSAGSGDVSWADALVRMAEAALEGLEPEAGAGRPASERYLVNLHLRADAPDPWGSVHLGPVLPADLRQRVGCDAQVRLWVTDHTGTVNVGRRQRVVDPRLRTVVEHRDQGCVVPGCGASRHLVVHHLVHWEHGGPTDTSNLVALCRAHHRAVHDGQLVFTGNPDLDTLVCRDRTGRPLGPVAVVPPPERDPEAGAEQLDLPTGGWTTRAGERADWRWFCWSETRPSRPSGPPPAPPEPAGAPTRAAWPDAARPPGAPTPPPAARPPAAPPPAATPPVRPVAPPLTAPPPVSSGADDEPPGEGGRTSTSSEDLPRSA
jgi:hypothetical protein